MKVSLFPSGYYFGRVYAGIQFIYSIGGNPCLNLVDSIQISDISREECHRDQSAIGIMDPEFMVYLGL